jgi:hypothetical protein
MLTDTLGEALFQGLPAGHYKFRATATNHQEIGGRLTLKTGLTLTQPVFLDYNLITVEWSVREITIQDRYEITLNATFETDVPAPVVVLQPASINLPNMKPGEVYYGELTLTNYGLIRADKVQSHLPGSDAYFRYEFLVDAPPVLEAKQRVAIPYRVTALQSLDGAAAASVATGGGCYNYYQTASYSCQSICSNGVLDLNCGASTNWFVVSSSCPGRGGSGGFTPVVDGLATWAGFWDLVGRGVRPLPDGQSGSNVTAPSSPRTTLLPMGSRRCVATPTGGGGTSAGGGGSGSGGGGNDPWSPDPGGCAP